MCLTPLLRAGSRLLRAALTPAAASSVLVSSLLAQPGLDGPESIGPFLNGNFPAVESTSAGEWSVQETYTAININLPMHLAPYPGTNKLLCVAKEGRIFLFEDSPTVSTTETFLDIRTQTFTSSDSGMTWLVFHPEFGEVGSPNRGYVYVTYKWKPSGGNGNEAFWRLSRFTVPDGTQAADPASEQILIQQYDRQQFHDSGCMMFGPDGFLYVAVGDEGGANDQYNDGQKINERLFSGILRIDVDQDLSRSHAIRRQPTQLTMPSGWPNSFTAHYTIPNDNPFLDAEGDNLEEFYAIGFRQPYRFSHDPVTQRTWIGESGQDTEEELCLLTKGANYGWPFREGKVAGPKAPPAVVHGTLTEPVWSVAHAAGPDGCVVGGFVYRGAAHPSLAGKFLAVDNVSGRIRSFDYNSSTEQATGTILTDMPSGSVYSGTSTIGRDQAGEPVFIKINGITTRGRFMKLAITPPTATNPVWYRFEDQAVENTSGYVSDNPGNKTVDSIHNGHPLVAFDDEANSSANVRYDLSNGIIPAGATTNIGGLRSIAAGDGDGRPGNAAGSLAMPQKFGRLDDFTVELSFKPALNSLGSGYQCFLGMDGMTGTASIDLESGAPLQPFRLMRWGRSSPQGNSLVSLQNGDLFLNVRSQNPANGQWVSVPIEVIDRTSFLTDQWYHLAIVGKVSTGTITVYALQGGSYVQIGQGTGYVGNLQSGAWSLGRGMHNGNAVDWVTDTTFDEVRIANTALTPSQFLYAGQWQPTIVVSEPPPLLSQTGAFSDLATLTPAQGVFPYDVNAPLWSDAAAKQRWIALPNDGTHDSAAEKIGFSPDGNWSFPAGTVFIKHFELPIDEANPSVHKRLETRFIVMPTTGEPYGVTYKWRADGSDADLLPDGLSEDITITEADGGTHVQRWDYPSRTDCRVCHNGNAGHILGPKTHQLNGDVTYERTGRTANQLETLAGIGWFDANYHPEHLPWFLKSKRITDTTASLEERVRSYIDSNCSQCHRPGGVRALFDARLTTPLAAQGLIRGSLVEPSEHERIIAPGDLDHSILRVRHASIGVIKMPPLAKNVVDQEAAQVIRDWILSLPSAPGVELDAPTGAGGPFQVDVHFSEPVTGLSASDFAVTGATTSDLTGSDADYELTLTPHGFGEVTVSLPAGMAEGVGGEGNFASAEKSILITDSSLLAWIPLDEGGGNSANDRSPHENHGTLLGMEPADWIAGKFGSALAFDGSSELVTMPNVATADFTISFWMRTTQTFQVTNAPPSGRAIVSADAPGPSNDFMIAGTQGNGINRISFQTGHAGGATPNSIIHGTSAVNTGEWIHVALTRSQSTGEMKIFVNGVEEASGIGSTSTLNANQSLSFGGNPAGAATSFQGDIDQFRIHDRVLPALEIIELLGENPGLPPYQQWLASKMPGLSHLHGIALDPEGDGVTNFGEFAFGGDPLSADIFPVPMERAEDGSVTLSYIARKAPAGAVYHVQVGDNMSTWNPADPDLTELSREDLPGGEYERITVKYLPPAASEKLFFRIEALPQ